MADEEEMGCLLPTGVLRLSWFFLHEEREKLYMKSVGSFAIRVSTVLKVLHYVFRRAHVNSRTLSTSTQAQNTVTYSVGLITLKK